MNTTERETDWFGPAPSGANEAYTDLQSAIGQAALRIADEHVDDFPGLLEFVEDNVLFVVGRPSRRAHGWFAPDSWRYGSAHATEIFISADRRSDLTAPALAIGMLTTVIHELAHARCHVDGIKDTSRQGRWHNRQFAMTALALGAGVERHPSLGHITPSLQPRALTLYAEQLRHLEHALILTWAPKSRQNHTSTPTGADPTGAPGSDADAKYVSAACACTDLRGRPRAIRVASGWWRTGPIICGVCQEAFQQR